VPAAFFQVVARRRGIPSARGIQHVNIAAETAHAYDAFAKGNHADAAERARRILRASPDDPAALTLMGRLALLSREPDIAWSIFDRLLARHPGIPAVWLDLAMALRDLGRHTEAADAVERALTLDRRDVTGWLKLAELKLALNERLHARDAFRKVLELDPNNVAAHRGLCVAEDVEPDAAIVASMEVLARSNAPKPREVAELHYTLAQVYRRAGRDAEFIRHLLAANATQRTLCADGFAEYDSVFDRLETAFTQDAFAKAARAAIIEPTPIFVLGMPRSGTTLVEQILAAHRDVRSAGELDYVRGPLKRAMEQVTGRPFPEGFETLSGGQLTEMAQAFARRLHLVGEGARYVTDKTPGNYHVLGLLRVLFPRCRIVHVLRDPMDTCFSMLQYPFDDRSPHTCDMELLAHVYARYLKLMNHWREMLGDEFITVEYERLVAAPATEARRLFEYCELEWDDSYLEVERGRNPVRTFSTTQVRRPIYTSSVGAWRPFADALTPLREALERELNRGFSRDYFS
jgi:tetratricopeptide (TPR) repeat protein